MFGGACYGWTHLHENPRPPFKKTTRTIKQYRPHLNPDLPPCRVCQRGGTGLHYGVITCEACKGFFRRNHRAPHLLKCSNSGNCKIELYSGSACTKCRYQKCIDVGMSEKAIKKGRYTAQRRTNFILEATSWKSDKSPQQIETFSCYNQQASDGLIQTLLFAHAEHVPSLHYLTDSNHDPADNISTCEINGLFVELLNSAVESDPESRINGIQGEIVLELESKIRPFVNFLKAIPGFIDLPSRDQTQLLKNGYFEYFLLEGYPGYNKDTGLLCPSIDKCFHIDDLGLFWGKDFILEVFTFAQFLKRLNLTLTELVLMETVCILSSDRCVLEDPQAVEALQWQAVSSLVHHHQINLQGSLRRFSKIMDRIAAMRVLSEQYYGITKNLRTWPLVQQQSLLRETLDL